MYKRDWVRRAEEDAEKAVVIVMCNVERAIKKRLEKNNMVLLQRAKVGRERERELDWDLGWNAGKNVYTVETYERYGTKQDEEEEEQTKHSF